MNSYSVKHINNTVKPAYKGNRSFFVFFFFQAGSQYYKYMKLKKPKTVKVLL